MSNEIELISDGDGLAVIGNSTDVERFLTSEGLMNSRDLDLPRLSSVLRVGSIAADVGSAIAANSGRWVKLTEKSVKLINQHGLMKGSESGLSRAIVQGKGGQIKGIVEFVKGPGALLASPAVLAGAAGIMAQLAMKQSMDEITDYLAAIDEKVDDVLRAQKNAVLADMIGVDLVIEEAMTVREHVGRVSEVTWSKVQATSLTIAKTQSYSLLQIDSLAEKLESKKSADDLAKSANLAKTNVQSWLAVLARCFQLQDALAILELDRVLDADPEELDKYRLGLKEARQNRRDLIARTTERLLARMDSAAERANDKVLLHPLDSKAIVGSTNYVASRIVVFHEGLGLTSDRDSVLAKRWVTAAVEMKDQLIETGADGVDAAARFGGVALDKAKSAGQAVAGRAAESVSRLRNRPGANEPKAD
jgi:hypothetical protein